jgi:MFS family permease
MSAATFRIVLLVSFAHALVHAFEVSLPSVEQMIGEDFGAGKEQTGLLGTIWRIPFGCGALLAGWLADRHGSKPLLLVFLGGCVLTSLISSWAPSLNVVFLAMFSMGCFASIYHPAGLALISRETNAENRPAALGWHGIFGSVGFTCAPLAAALAFSAAALSWRQYYVLLCIPAVIIALLLAVMLKENRGKHTIIPLEPAPAGNGPIAERAAIPGIFYYLVLVGALSGFVYAGFMHFLPRYMYKAFVGQSFLPAEGVRNYLAAIVLGFAVIGQALAGRFARPGKMERQLSWVMFANVPCLLGMAVAEGPWRLAAACLFALVHFMNQPIYNSLIADFVPAERRSLGYGFSNMMCFGIGALGPFFAGMMITDFATYSGLAAVIALAGLLAWFLSPPRPINAEMMNHSDSSHDA